MATPLDDLELERAADARKGDAGHVLVVAGSHRYTNTPAIVGTAALRTGVDLLTVAAPHRAAYESARFALNTVTLPLAGEQFSKDHIASIEWFDAVDCLAVGPGLGTTDHTQEGIRKLLAEWEGPAVIDADAVTAIADADEIELQADWVLTPHDGEFERLTGEEVPADMDDRADAVQAAADEHGCIILLKGPMDVVSDGDQVETNETGNPTMSRGGTGDALTGVITGLIAQGNDPFDAAVAGAWLTGAAGDAALDEHGPGYLLEELVDAVGSVLHEES